MGNLVVHPSISDLKLVKLVFRPKGSQDLALMSVRIIFETVILLIELHWNELESSNIAQHEETHSDHYKQD